MKNGREYQTLARELKVEHRVLYSCKHQLEGSGAAARKFGPPSVVHHSEQGIKPGCKEIHRGVGGAPHDSEHEFPYDNTACESFRRTLKQEEINCTGYADFDELHQDLEESIDRYYSQQRLHSALGYRTPEEFAQAAATPA